MPENGEQAAPKSRKPKTSLQAGRLVVAIAPFSAVRYNPEITLSKVTSPPNDVIPDDELRQFWQEDHNICHIILPAPAEGDQEFPASPNKYERARDRIHAWLEDGTFTRDAGPAFYLYEIKHDQGVMTGFFARLKIDPTYTEIRRHELTLKKKKTDRLNLKTATNTDTESIWMLYRDERGWVDEILRSNAHEELCRFTDEEGLEHAVWRVDRPEAVGEIVAQFEDRTVVIADGHHRYQTALDHYANTGKDTDATMLVCFVRDTDPGLRIEPTHRLLYNVNFTLTNLDALPWARGELPLPDNDAEAGAMIRAWVDEVPGRCVVLHADGAVALTLNEPVSEGRGRLDALHVTAVHDKLLAPLGITDPEAHIHYTRTATEAVQKVRSGEYPYCIMLAGEDVDSVLDVASAGHVMPQKSTYFVPKLRSGLVLSPLDEPSPVGWQEIAGDGGTAEFKLPEL